MNVAPKINKKPVSSSVNVIHKISVADLNPVLVFLLITF
jgi:hypothetical protein